MLKPKLSPVVVALTLVTGTVTTLAYAAEDSYPAEQAALESARITLSDAIGRAETQTKGKVLEAELESKNGSYVYEIEVVTDTSVTKLAMDPGSGNILTSKAEGIQNGDEDEAHERGGIANTKVSLSQAINAAEQHLQGAKAKAAGLEADDGKLFYEVEVLKDGRAHEVTIDPVSGKVLSFSLDNGQDDHEDENGENS